MNTHERRILRVFLEAMADGLDALGRKRMWERMVGVEAEKYDEHLTPVAMERSGFHETVLGGCAEVLKNPPSLNYGEVVDDLITLENMSFESYLSSEELLLLGQKKMLKNIARLQENKDLRESLARRAFISLTDAAA